MKMEGARNWYQSIYFDKLSFRQLFFEPQWTPSREERINIFSVVLILLQKEYIFICRLFQLRTTLICVNFCDFLTPTDAVTENPRKYFIAKKYMYDYPNRLGWRQNVL